MSPEVPSLRITYLVLAGLGEGIQGDRTHSGEDVAYPQGTPTWERHILNLKEPQAEEIWIVL